MLHPDFVAVRWWLFVAFGYGLYCQEYILVYLAEFYIPACHYAVSRVKKFLHGYIGETCCGAFGE